MRRNSIVVGARGSALARWQSDFVIAALKRFTPDLPIERRVVKTAGDKDKTRPLGEIGGLGVFTKEIEDALLSGAIDLAVHSLKDLPTDLAPGLALAAIPEREDPRDCLVSRDGLTLLQLPPGARVGTSSARRAAQLRALRADLNILPLRGNVDTRLRQAHGGGYDGVVLAAAGVIRLGRASEITEYLPLDLMLPDPGQGALAVQIRADAVDLAALVTPLDHAPTRAAVTAERAFLRALGGGCRMPIAAHAERRGDELCLRGLVACEDGSKVVRGELCGDPARAEAIGAELAQKLLCAGADRILGQNGSAFRETSLPPLHGKRILITRAKEQASALAGKIRALGGEPLEFPTIEFAPLQDFGELDDVLRRVGAFDWVVFTSVNGVRAVAERLTALGQTPQALARAKIAAIGPSTALAIEGLGLSVDFIPTKFLGEQIAAELPSAAGQRALLLRADMASDALARGLQARGVGVTDVDAYRTVRPQPEPAVPPFSQQSEGGTERRVLDLSRADAITFTSSSTVRNFVAMLDGDAHDALARLVVFCIGPVTAETARELGLRVEAVAGEHTIDGLVAALVNYYRGK